MRFLYRVYSGGKSQRARYRASFFKQLLEIWNLHRLNQLEPWEYFQFHLSDPKLSWEEKLNFMSYNQACHFHRIANPTEQRGLTLNKLATYFFLKALDIPTPEVYGLFDPEHGFTMRNKPLRNEEDLARLIDSHRLTEFVLKPVSKGKGEGIRLIVGKDGKSFVAASGERYSTSELFELCFKQYYSMERATRCGLLLQERVRQHDVIQKVNPGCVNCCRVITLINDQGKVEVLVTEMKFGTGRSVVDNIDKGGFAVMIDESGQMMPAAILLPDHIEYRDCHPTTGERFAGLQVPYFHEAVKIAIRAQSLFPQLRSLAWDIAITHSGPTVLEGNAWWGYTVQGDSRKGLLTPSVRKVLDEMPADG